jgi:histidinol dehydrogenase
MSRQPSPLRLLDARDPGFPEAFALLENRRLEQRAGVDETVAGIVRDVRERGDAAVLDAIERYDGYRLTQGQLRVTQAEITGAAAVLDPADREALRLAAERIRSFHAERIPQSWQLDRPGERLGQEIRAIGRVAIYVPAFKAPLASSLLMLAIPASVAGVRDLVLASPGQEIHPAILEAARLAGVTQFFRMGGAQAIAALAYGTETVPRVDKIVGPGSVWVQAAKRQVFGQVGIDAEAGPSEVVVVADDAAAPDRVAADLLAQAEHEELASVLLATPSRALAAAVQVEIVEQLADLPRREIATRSLRERSAIVITADLAEALEIANRYAPEHLQLLVAEPERWLPKVENAGAVFLGDSSPVPLGDYVAGPSHVLPTGGTARFFSPIGVEDFQKRMSVIQLDAASLERVAPSIIRLARLEGLDAHARAVERRVKGS